MKKYTKEELMALDNELYLLATYEASQGMMPTYETEEDLFKHKRKMAKCFNEFKRGIQTGRWDLEFIRNNVFARNSAVYQDPDAIIDDIIDGNDGSIIKEKPTLPTMRDFENILFEQLDKDEESEGEDDGKTTKD